MRFNAKRRKGDITARYAKYALYGLYRIWDQIKPADKTAYGKWPIFDTVLSNGNIRMIYHRHMIALSGQIAVIFSVYIRTVKLMATPPHDAHT